MLDSKLGAVITEADVITLSKAFKTPSGKAALEVLNRVFYNQLSFDYLDPNVERTIFNDGRRGLVQLLNSCAKFDGEQVEEKEK